MSEQIATPEPRRIPGRFEQNWTAEEINTLRLAWRDRNIPREKIPGMLRERSMKAVEAMAKTLNLGPRDKAPEWTQEQDQTIRDLWHTVSRQEIASFIGRTADAVSNRANRLKLGTSKYQRAKLAARAAASLEAVRAKKAAGIIWTEEEVAILRKLWPDVGAIHAATKRSWAGIERQAYKHKLPPRTGFSREARGVPEKREPAPPPEPVVLIDRRCLCCGVPFKAETRFIRMCGPCKRHRG